MGIVTDSGLHAEMSGSFSLMLFSTDPGWIVRNVAAGVSAIIVDWERNGKVTRQSGADTQIGVDTLEDLERVRAATDARIICRINGYGDCTRREVDQAISAGADEILSTQRDQADALFHPGNVSR